jgi:diacylglycerol kinase family enzyme
MLSPVEVIINARSGAGDNEALSRRVGEILTAAGVEARVSLARGGAEVVELARRAARGDAQVVAAGGGDGTINAVASELVGTDKVLGVLPLGTFNYFARNLGIPLDAEAAARNLIEGGIVGADVGEVNGQLFLVNASLGLYPRILRQREQEYRRWGRSRIAAYYSVLRAVLRPVRILRLRLMAAGRDGEMRRTPLIFVCSNAYQMREINVAGVSCADEGKLAVYITRPTGRLGLVWLAALTFLRRLDAGRDLEVLCLDEAVISARREKLRLAIDGEIKVLTTPLNVRLRRGALKVIAPAFAPQEIEAKVEAEGSPLTGVLQTTPTLAS